MAKAKDKELSWPTRTPLPGVYVRRITTAHLEREKGPFEIPDEEDPPKSAENQD